ncbi:NlpC/P60 family protein [Deinococcus sp.]|uniref:NlpC/P60 family protein n=1 Tax=Deinococcus sp. TaxID=47478 RepID=UPI003B5BC844
MLGAFVGASLLAGTAQAAQSITVQRGDTAYAVAQRAGLSVDALLNFNNLPTADLEVGQVLWLTAPLYTVVRGDTAFSVARKAGLTVDKLLSLNNLGQADLEVGQVLRLRDDAPDFVSTLDDHPNTYTSIVVTPIDVRPLTRPAPRVPVANPPSPSPQTATAVQADPAPDTPQPIAGPTLPASSQGGPSSSDWLTNAQQLLGTPYRYGGTGLSGLDCSGFVLQVFTPLGLNLPRTSAEQAQVGVPVERSALQAGDLVFFDIEGRGSVSHVGIVVEGDTFMDANSYSGRVAFDDLGSDYWARRYIGARRVLGAAALSGR